MKSPDSKASEPPLQIENIDNDEEKEKSVQKTTNTLTNPSPHPNLSQNNTPSQPKKAERKIRKTTPATLKTPDQPIKNTQGLDVTQRTIEVANAAVINNNRITTPVTFQFRPPNNISEFSVSKAHQNIFEALKLLDPTLKFVTFNGAHVDTIEQFPSTQETYTSTFKDIHKESDNSRVYVSHKIESSKPLSELKHGSRNCMSNIFETLVKNNAFLSHKKFNSHKEHSIGFFMKVNPKITLRNEMRERIQDQLMFIDLEDEETKKLMHPIKDKNGKPTGSERIVLPPFDLYSKNIGHGNGDQRISTFAYEIRTTPDHAVTLKNILCKISMTDSNELTFVPYGIDSLVKGKDIIRSMIIQQNTFLTEVAIVPIFGVQKEETDKFYEIFSKALYFSGLEPTRKTKEEGKYLLITTTANKYNAQLEADRLLTKHFKNANVARRSPTRSNNPIINNHLLTYAEVLSQTQIPTPDNYPLLKSPPFNTQRPFSISFSSHRNDDSPSPPLQKRKIISDSNSLVTNTTFESTAAPVTLDETTNIDIREEVKEMLGEMKNEIMTQVDAVIKKQLSSVIKEMKFQMKDMFKVMMTEMTTTNTNNENNEQTTCDNDDISYEEEQEDEEMDIMSSDEDTDLYTDQEPTRLEKEKSIQRAQKNKMSSKRRKPSSRRSKRSK